MWKALLENGIVFARKARERERAKRTVCFSILQKWSRERTRRGERSSERERWKRRCFRIAKTFFRFSSSFEEIVSGAGNLKRSSSFLKMMMKKNFFKRAKTCSRPAQKVPDSKWWWSYESFFLHVVCMRSAWGLPVLSVKLLNRGLGLLPI